LDQLVGPRETWTPAVEERNSGTIVRRAVQGVNPLGPVVIWTGRLASTVLLWAVQAALDYELPRLVTVENEPSKAASFW
jgi:hypothetical protein